MCEFISKTQNLLSLLCLCGGYGRKIEDVNHGKESLQGLGYNFQLRLPH
jgi:hypothetical protein